MIRRIVVKGRGRGIGVVSVNACPRDVVGKRGIGDRLKESLAPHALQGRRLLACTGAEPLSHLFGMESGDTWLHWAHVELLRRDVELVAEARDGGKLEEIPLGGVIALSYLHASSAVEAFHTPLWEAFRGRYDKALWEEQGEVEIDGKLYARLLKAFEAMGLHYPHRHAAYISYITALWDLYRGTSQDVVGELVVKLLEGPEGLWSSAFASEMKDAGRWIEKAKETYERIIAFGRTAGLVRLLVEDEDIELVIGE